MKFLSVFLFIITISCIAISIAQEIEDKTLIEQNTHPTVLGRYHVIIFSTSQGMFMQWNDSTWKIEMICPYGCYSD